VDIINVVRINGGELGDVHSFDSSSVVAAEKKFIEVFNDMNSLRDITVSKEVLEESLDDGHYEIDGHYAVYIIWCKVN